MKKKKKETRGRKANKNTVQIRTTVELEYRDKAKDNHGTISNAIRFAAKKKPSQD